MSAELGAYRSSKTEPIQTDPWQFWKNEDTTYRNVVMQAQKLLCMPATSVPCERIFSVAGEILSADVGLDQLCVPIMLKCCCVCRVGSSIGPYSVV